MTAHTPIRRNLHAEVTDNLIRAIEAGVGDFALPWRQAPLHLPVNVLTGKRYQGINIVNLWASAFLKGYASHQWGTYRQWAEKGLHIRKGEKASLVLFYKEFGVDPDPEDADDNGSRRVARGSAVFNADQVEGFEKPVEGPLPDPFERLAQADAFVGATGAEIRHGGDRAFYRPDTDHIQMPDEGLFTGTETMTRIEGYYATLVHELVHWTGAEKRLNRQFGKRFGDATYAAEELVAELGAAFLCAELGITQEVRPDHAQYLAHWLKLLKEDSRALTTAAARASEAATYLAERRD
jgi:antirestriction protein ArdC